MDDESHAAELDSYGPGADLMISLFAIALLLLALVGASQQFETFSAAAATRPPATTPPSTEGAAPPPLQIVALAKYDALLRKYEQQLASEAALEAERERQRAEIERADERLAQMRAALEDAENRLAERVGQTVGDHVDLAEFEVPVTMLEPFFGASETLSVDLEDRIRRRMSQKAAAMPDGANDLVIETFVPPELLALAPDDLDNESAISQVFRISMSLGEAYRAVLARAGIPLACLRVSAGAFEQSAETRLEIMRDAIDPVAAMDEFATFLRQPNSGVEIDKAAASVRIMLGVYPKTQLCDPALLADSLARL